ncbi:pentatricopeptide repeat-containing protein At5g61990, mitochondrial-like [Malania oleifera]|uniref:pentatricopeptide repeat-containing protein At5g61990, mitochondrial-like n=1 Tax=Malania oleifera TaxID=397392 RepID=UPI0025ADE3E9|nr:pentatricopeptide repeat-containing protein At5g61990, mitochondrial-like [Malania oleifera]XP_057975109.1 pentatricopeptide repeat-containing protein At5g61990, mitochondrial-like [Malania oleifera]XP_057975110.1 pentatricopeptide repeat-containing protein At5g61990, mitochondrial-like [Malania oleifera]XP_057975112.1 pentatricopeptide repeat-containing protein At5g61990, mitochondrial-like [Malania oleifera]XP_057975113.1 pentatricopeptide repeat-containing protein At5g61990, mitochondrial
MRPCPSTLYCRRFFSTARATGTALFNPSSYPTCQTCVQNDDIYDQSRPQFTEDGTDHLLYLKQFFSLIRTLSAYPRNYKALNALDSMLTKTHYFDSAMSVFVIVGLSRLKKLGRAKNVLLNLKTNVRVPEYFLFSLVFDFLVKDGRICDVEIVWDEVCGSELPSHCRFGVSDYVIHVCKFGGACEIKRVCERVLMGGRVLEQQSYVALIGALCRVNEGLLARGVLIEMNGKGFEADDLTYLVMFQCFCRNEDLSEADLILRRMVRRKCHLDICVYGSFIHGLCKSGKFREADKLFCKLTKRESFNGLGQGLLKEGRRVIFQLNCHGAVPEVMAYESYFRSLCSVGKLDEAEMLLKKMMKKRTVLEACVYGSFIKALFRAGQEDDAIKFFNVERRKGLVHVEDITKFVIVELCKKGKIDEASRIFYEDVLSGKFVNDISICNCILDSFWKAGRTAEAESLFERILNGSFGVPDILTYKVMINGFFSRGNISRALCIFEEMQNSNIPVNGNLYEMIIRGLCDHGRLKEAYRYLNEMTANGHLVSCAKWTLVFHSMFLGNEHEFGL